MLIGVTTAIMAGVGFILGSAAMSTDKGKDTDKQMQDAWEKGKKILKENKDTWLNR